MNYIKQFESFDDILSKVDDIAAYMPTSTTEVISKWIPSTFDVKKILSNSDYKKYNGKLDYIKYYSFGFNELSKFFIAESEITNRSNLYGLDYLIINFGRDYRIVFIPKSDFIKIDKSNIIKNIDDAGWDVLFMEDVKIDKDEFDIIYEDDDILAVKPKTYKAAIKYSSDSKWKAAFRKNKDWIEKYISKSSYYGGYNWYNSITKKEVETWWSKLIKSNKSNSDKQLKEFVNDFPRYLFYIVILKNVPAEDNMNKIFLLYDVSRSEYGQLPFPYSSSYFFNGYAGDMLDAAHNQVKVTQSNGRMITLRDIHGRHGALFNRAFRQIEYDFNEEKDKLYDLLGFWSDIGGEYRDDALVFIRGKRNPDRLQITKPSLIKKNDDGSITYNIIGYYDDEKFDYWDYSKPKEKEIPNKGKGYKDFFQVMSDDTKLLRNAIDKEYKL
jgi:hypothetical protein